VLTDFCDHNPTVVALSERIKMSTRGGWIVKPENHKLFAAVKPGPETPDIFPDTPGNPENPGKCPDSPAC
jgi:hypothetical protein